ncbi:MAG TPA: hypothetical protein VKA26_03535 [Ignavibacteriaceae bacterium]|nr:hypothetical protein [Ignavibacteriaceae bacterium]
MKAKLILTFLVISINLFSQENPGAKHIAMANSDIAVSNNVFALFNNPGGLAQINWREFGAFYSPSPFGLKELSNAYAAYAEPFTFGTAAIGAMTYGFDLYRENKITVGFSYKYSEEFFIGVAVNYKQISIKNYGDKNSFLLDVGAIAYINDNLHLGFSYKNATKSTYGLANDELPVIIQTGVSYRLIDNFVLALSVEKDIRYPFSPRIGFEYNIVNFLSLRSGFSKEPSRYSAGIGIHYSVFNFNYALFTHQELGITHQFGVVISFNKKK